MKRPRSLRSLSPLRAGTAVTVATRMPLDSVSAGDSIAVSGVCLTVTAIGAGAFTADASKETLSKTVSTVSSPTIRSIRTAGANRDGLRKL